MNHQATRCAETSENPELLDAFRSHYQRFVEAIQDAVQNGTDSVVLERLGDDLEEFNTVVNEVGSM